LLYMNTARAVIALLFLALAQNSCGQPTTPYLHEVFYGKCLEKNPTDANCSLLWETFALGAAKDMRIVTDLDFMPFFQVANFSTPKDNALFWSGNKNFANTLAADGTRFTTLEETSTGYVLNGLQWCGKPASNDTSPDFDYENPCAYAKNSSYYGSQGVWNQCSYHFANNVQGNVTIILQPQQLFYGSGPYLAYRNTSIFYLIELPTMNTTLVSAITILLLANTTRAPNEKCGSGSLKDLHNDIYTKFQFLPKCVDDPNKIIDILCNDGQENTPECMAAYMTAHDTPVTPKDSRGLLVWAILGSCVSVVLMVAVVLLYINVVKLRNQLIYEPIR